MNQINFSLLAFGEKKATINNNPLQVAYSLSEITPLEEFKPLGQLNKFAIKASQISLNNLILNNHIFTPTRIVANEIDSTTLVIPLRGSCTTIMEGKKYIWDCNSYAFFREGLAAESFSKDNWSNVIIKIDKKQFITQAKLMLGIDQEENFIFDFQSKKLIPLTYKYISFLPIWKEIFYMINQYYDSLEDLEKIKFDNFIYRMMVMFILPEKFFDEQSNTSRLNSYSLAILKLIEQIKDESFVAFMNLSDLERFTKLSTRSLQLIFKKNFGMTPSQFLREQKLKFARNMLLDKDNSMNVTQVALEIGCINFSQFAKYYKEQFGELPSETLKKLK